MSTIETAPDKPKPSPRIGLVSGIHDFTYDDHRRTWEQVKNGNLDSYVWNREVAQLIASESYSSGEPLVLAIDGIYPILQAQLLTPADPEMKLISRWASLPARPSRLSSQNEVYVVAGDFAPPIKGYGRNQLSEAEEKWRLSHVLENTLLAVSVLGIMNSRAIMEKRISRRGFLKNSAKVAGIAAGLTFARTLPRFLGPLISDRDLHEFFQEIDSIVSPRLFRSEWLDGRTALLMTKLEETAESGYIPEESAEYVLLMGNSHQDRYPQFRQQGNRDHAIKIFAQETIDITRMIYARTNNISIADVPPEALNRMLDYFSAIEIFKVTDPGDFPIASGGLGQFFTDLASFKSQKIEGIIKDLRPQANL